jgi:hypothetical protein
MMYTFFRGILAGFCMLVLGVSAVRAQQQSNDKAVPPIPAYHSPLASAANNDDAEDVEAGPQKLAPDTRPLAGAQDFSLGAPALTHSYWQPHVNVTTTADSSALSTTQNTGWTTWTSLSAGVDLHRISGRSDLTLDYLGGGTISNNGSAQNGIIQGLTFGDKLNFRRFGISILDQLSYIPESSFGYGGLGGLNTPWGGTIGLQSGWVPGQSILTSRGQRVSNTFVTQVDASLTPRSSFTLVGSYGLLHFFDSSLLNLGDAAFQMGYNYQMTREDTVAVLYRFSAYRYSNFNQSIDSHSVQLSYGRRITGRLAFQIAAGPQVGLFRTPIPNTSGPPSGAGTPTSSSTQLYWSLNTALTYQLRRTGLGLSYSHGLNSGSGVLGGAVADIVSGSVTRAVSRRFSGGWNVGFARNQGLAITPSTTPNQSYDYWFSGLNLSHPWGRSLNVYLNYLLQYQNSNSSFCLGVSCGTSFVRHQVSMGVSWQRQTLPF